MSSKKKNKTRLGILLSGGGRTMVNIAEEITAGNLDAEIATVVSSRSNVAGVERARELGFRPHVIRKKDYPDVAEFSKRIYEALDADDVNLVLQCGWLCLWEIPLRYEYRVMNIHPALLPAFPGTDGYGDTFRYGCKVGGCTVHFIDYGEDSGPIIGQKTFAISEDDTIETIRAKGLELEWQLYPECVQLFAQKRLAVIKQSYHAENGLIKNREIVRILPDASKN